MSAAGKKKAKPSGASSRTKAKAKVTKPKKVVKQVPAEEKPKKAAPRAKKPVGKKEVAPKVVQKTVAKAKPLRLGPPPAAIVALMHIDSSQERAARGYSFGELASAGVPLNAAKRQDLPLDIRRRSVVERNVEMLKGWFKQPGQAPAGETAEKRVAVAATSRKK